MIRESFAFLLAVVVVLLLALFEVVLFTCVGALAGLIVDVTVLGEGVRGLLSQVGLHVSCWQIGALIGFISGMVAVTIGGRAEAEVKR